MTDVPMSSRPMAGTAVVAPTGSGSGVTWSAIFAGGLTAGAVSLLLLLLGSSFGLASISPWADAGASSAAFGVGAAIWLVVVQWVSAGLGGYLAGRLRTKWVRVHTDEVFFRDTAHGFLAWALSTIIMVGLLASAVTSIVGAAASGVTSIASGAAEGAAAGAAGGGDPMAYFTDSLFRPDPEAPVVAGAAPAGSADIRAEAGRILVRGLAADEVPDEDLAYLTRIVQQETGLSAGEAEVRVNEVVGAADDVKQAALQAADDARKAAATLAIYSFASLLIGAFIACVAAAIGGRQRDDIEVRTATL